MGQTSSADFPAIDSAHTNLLGGSDGFLARIQSATPQVNVTFDTSPSGLSVFVDGASNSTPASVSWPAGSIHIIFAPPVSAGEGIQYAWTSWSDGGAFVHRVAPMSDTTFTANFKLQYFLGMYATNLSITSTNPTVNQTNIGALSPKSGWFDPGTDLIISTIPPLGASFAGWVGAGSGSFSGLDNPASITMNGPVTETATFTGPLTNRLKLIINGTGTVSPNYNGQALRIGKVYSMTAKPGAGYAFANWTGDIPTNISPKLTFLMQNGLVLQANFIPSPFGPVKGTYAGLFYETNSISPASSGFFTLDLTEQGNFSAKIVSLGRTYKFTSHFSTEGNFVGFVPRLGLSTLFITLRLDLTGGNVITGEINDTTRTAELVANRAVYSKSNPAPQAGRKYTLIVPGGEPSYARPAGDGYGSLSVDQSGNITFSGAMGDAVKVSQRTFVSGQNEWPFFVSYQAGAGVAIGWLSFTNEAGSAISGAVNWSKLGLAVTNIYPGGFSIETEGLGSIYSFTSGQPVLDLGPGGGWLIFEDGNLSQNITNRVLLDSNNKITNLSSNKLTMTVTTSSGLFQGSVVDPASGKTLGFKGALFQKQNFGAGYFLNGRQTGRVLLLP